jgi:tripartite-type tricarboxylate transporter receptor subunit TctC
MLRLTRRRALANALIGALSATRARAAYPHRPIRVVSPYAAGGVGENIMRLLAVSMEPRLGQKLIVEARPGAAGNLGTEEVARARPDGETILIAATNNFVINQFVIKMTFDPLAALTPITKAAEIPLVLFSNPQVPARTLQEFIAYTKANPRNVSYGVPSLGTVNHLMMERLKQITGMDMTCIPYRGSPPAVLALMKKRNSGLPNRICGGWHQPQWRQADCLSGRYARTRPNVAQCADYCRVRVSGLRRFELVRYRCSG